MRLRFAGVLALLSVTTAVALPAFASSAPAYAVRMHGAAGGALGKVRFIDRGLGVQPPKKRRIRGRVKMPLLANYGLHTGATQRASIGFKDGSVLHMNQLTDAVLRSPSVTYLTQGEVDQVVIPGTKHKIRTAAAVASAIGTVFDVKISVGVTVVTVLQGVVKVKTAKGSVEVTTNQQTSVSPGQRPSPPVTVDARAAVGWSQGIPSPTSNLVQNGNAEAAAGAPNDSTRVAVPHWVATGTFTTVQYGAAGFPSQTDFGPPNRGKNFFAGGPGAALSTGIQVIDVARFANNIDSGALVMYVAAWLGGYASQDDNATATFTCEDVNLHSLNHVVTLGPTTAAQRHSVTGLIEWHGSISVPAHTRFIRVVLTMTRVAGSYNDGYADNLSVILDRA